ncbi:hypothetical protein JR316_0013135 [Psilocybe cubensis]|uniref:Uncharacterized protein n=1 Tax=Psilocybe cubensis TaxID=181762 RepID=A0ACB8GHI4_PSICU|nr:hypothetical protein JR316_0013135 [Psilocybe cubensis]KAH9474671.1 hypothetical protein JR316_0013135 [Psilocybe cubensis]
MSSHPHIRAAYFRVSLDEAQEALKDCIENLMSTTAPATLRNREKIRMKFLFTVQAFEPDLEEHRLWFHDTLEKYYQKFLVFLVLALRQPDGTYKCTAGTMKEAYLTFCWHIARFAVDAQGKLIGSKLLSAEGYHQFLKDQCYTLITKYKLARHQKPRIMLTEFELRLIVEQNLLMSQKFNRLVALQRICLALTLFYTLCRPGSLGPSEKVYKQDKKYPCVKHVKFIRIDRLKYRVKLQIMQLKGHNTTFTGEQREYILEPVKNWFNIMLEHGIYMTIEDLANSTDLYLPIDPTRMEEPLFLASGPGGRGFKDPPEPMVSTGITAGMKTVAVKNKFGKDVAETLLTHIEPGSHKFYSSETAAFDLTGMMLNELPIPLDANKMAS